MPGKMIGKVTFQNVVRPSAYRSMPASSSDRVMPANRARMVTTTKLMLNMMCAARMVKKPRSTPRLTHSVSRPRPG